MGFEIEKRPQSLKPRALFLKAKIRL